MFKKQLLIVIVVGATTRMTATVPGRTQDPDNPPAERDPKLVSPAVLYMCSEDAPTGVTISASGGHYNLNAVFVNDGVDLGVDATFEDLLPNAEQLLDMSQAHARERPQRRR